MKGEGVQPSRTAADLRPREAAHMVRVAQRSLEDAAALTAGWTRRQLIDVCLTLALGAQDRGTDQPMRPVRAVAPLQERPARPHALAYIGPRYDVAEAAWTDQELRDAHAAWGRGERDLWAEQGERLYQRITHRRQRRPRKDAS